MRPLIHQSKTNTLKAPRAKHDKTARGHLHISARQARLVADQGQSIKRPKATHTSERDKHASMRAEGKA
eukprot:6181217-Pleurochrysis_carterae.AAC.2